MDKGSSRSVATPGMGGTTVMGTGGAKTNRRPELDHAPRSKRAKYAAAACDECKRRKLKCVKDPGATQCIRCSASEVACSLRDDKSNAYSETAQVPEPASDGFRIDRLERELQTLRRQVAQLVRVAGKGQTPRSDMQGCESVCTPSQTSVTAAGVKERKEVQFVGPTRPAFALNVAKATLSMVDEPSDDGSSSCSEAEDVARPSTASPEVGRNTGRDPLLGMPLSKIYHLLDVFGDEIEPVYPLLDTSSLRSRAPDMIRQFDDEYNLTFDGRLSQKDIHLLKIVLATALVVDNQGKTELSSQLIASFEDDALRITSPSDVDLQEAQIFAIMSIYHFHCDEELLAYRSIGISTRMVLELGLHRRRSLNENYPDPVHRSLAIRVFWCIYVLDRRWSFGTGLSFALIDRDLDPRLPDPPCDLPYFCCLVAYGKLCSRVWDAIPHYGSSSEALPPSTETLLENDTQGWFSSIPDINQVMIGDTATDENVTRHDQRLFQHMQTLLYLRGNYVRCLIHRQHVVSATNIGRNPVNARLVVSIAQDTIRILVNLNDTSDIYSRHQVAYNYFLISAISIMLLAVCHAPAEFAQTCRQDFFSAINLVRGFSRLSLQGRRLWSSLRGLVTRLKQLGIMNDEASRGQTEEQEKPRVLRHERTQISGHGTEQPAVAPIARDYPTINMQTPANHEWLTTGATNFQTTTPDMDLMGDDLMGVFDTFGRAYMDHNINPVAPSTEASFDENLSFLNGDADDFSEYFMHLI